MRFFKPICFCYLIFLPIGAFSQTPFAQIHQRATQPSRQAATQATTDKSRFETRAFLREFHAQPKRFMNRPFPKWDEQGLPVDATFSAFGPEILNDHERAKARDRIRAMICSRSISGCRQSTSARAAFDDENQIRNFLFESDYVANIFEIESKNLQNGQVAQAPWSDSFWPQQKGLIARRWTQKDFPNSSDFMVNYNYYLAHPPSSSAVNSLSPAEKYDLLVGDSSFRLTEANWEEGRSSFSQTGRVPGWAGICHGWAPASMMTDNPQKSVTVLSARGTPITFYPSDIKALASAAWGASPPRNYLVGTRCNTARPSQDEYGRVINSTCFDVNPGTWHMAVINEIGWRRRGFVIDAQYDFQVWNYPLYSYRYYYFNPQTLETSSTISGSVISLADFKIDKFKRYRNPDAKNVVGIAMEISYAIETSPSKRPSLKPRLHSVKMLYDLELDAEGQILGGEWYSNFHPDFIWHFAPDTKPYSERELALMEQGLSLQWDGKETVPDILREAARNSSSRGQPLWTVVEAIIALSQ